MPAAEIVAGAVAIGLALYVVAGVGFLAVAQISPQSEALAEADRDLARYHALIVSYTAGWRKAVLVVALLAYVCAAIDLFQADAAALAWLCVGVGIDCGLFLTWRDRAAFMGTLSPQERMSDVSGVAALGLALIVTAFLRFSGALA
jgi:hypothetical protein